MLCKGSVFPRAKSCTSNAHVPSVMANAKLYSNLALMPQTQPVNITTKASSVAESEQYFSSRIPLNRLSSLHRENAFIYTSNRANASPAHCTSSAGKRIVISRPNAAVS